MILDAIQFSIHYFMPMFVVMVPLAIVALFVRMTPSYSVEERLGTAKTSCLVALAVVEFFAIFGGKFLNFLEYRWVHFAQPAVC
jgi:small neutral amino acid transporter SnatA (MarC family)